MAALPDQSHQAAQDLGGAPAQARRIDIERAGAFLLALVVVELGTAKTAGSGRQRIRHHGGATALIGGKIDHVLRCGYAFFNHCCLLAKARVDAPSTFETTTDAVTHGIGSHSLGFIAEKFLSNVQPTAQILLEEMGRLCSRIASEIIVDRE